MSKLEKQKKILSSYETREKSFKYCKMNDSVSEVSIFNSNARVQIQPNLVQASNLGNNFDDDSKLLTTVFYYMVN